MTRQWLVRYSELFLKSDPVRRRWEQVLIANILKVSPEIQVRSERGRIWLSGEVIPEWLEKIFGVISFSEVEQVPLGRLDSVLPDYCRCKGMEKVKTFAIRMKRVGNHTFTSHEKAIEYGNLIRRTFPHLKVNLATPDKEIFIEIRGYECYLYDSMIKGPGGLPLGVEGTLVALLSGGIDSPVATWMMMKRGCRIIPLFIALDSVLDETNRERAESVVEALRAYQPDIELCVITDSYLSRAKQELTRVGLEKYTCIFCKRRMYRVAEKFARNAGAKGFVTGESLGQVASQTLDNLMVLNEAATMPVYRPLIGFDKEETIRIAREIGTFAASITHATGCTAVPKGPSTKADLDTIRQIEKELLSFSDTIPLS